MARDSWSGHCYAAIFWESWCTIAITKALHKPMVLALGATHSPPGLMVWPPQTLWDGPPQSLVGMGMARLCLCMEAGNSSSPDGILASVEQA